MLLPMLAELLFDGAITSLVKHMMIASRRAARLRRAVINFPAKVTPCRPDQDARQ